MIALDRGGTKEEKAKSGQRSGFSDNTDVF